MLILWPVTVIGPRELPELAPPQRATPIAWLVVGLWLAFAALDVIAAGAIAHGWSWIPAPVSRTASLLVASARLYLEPDLFHPAQLWSAALVHEPLLVGQGGWFVALWSLAMDVGVFLVVARAIERTAGSLGLLTGMLVLPPLVAAVHLRLVDGVPGGLATAPALVVATASAAWALLHGRRVRLALAWWLVVVAGFAPLTLALGPFVFSFVSLEAVRGALALPPQEAIEHLLALSAALVAGHAIGLGVRLAVR